MKDVTRSWFRIDDAKQHVDLRLFCFPYAGGAASIYRDWADHLPVGVEVVAVELPGRGNRLNEAPFLSLPPLMDVLTEAILPLLEKPFVFFGHSMGALIAFELARRLPHYQRRPRLLFASGRRAPQIPDSEPATYKLPKDEFIAELHRMDGTPEEVLEHDELMALMIPLLRADFQLTQTYQYLRHAPLCCSITAFGGLQDCEVTRDVLLPWREQTSSAFVLRMLPGDHFFLRSSRTLLLGLIARELREVMEIMGIPSPVNHAQRECQQRKSLL